MIFRLRCLRLLPGFPLLAWTLRAVDDSKVLYPSPVVPAEIAAGGGFGSLSLALGLALAVIGGWLVWRGRRSRPGQVGLQSLVVSETRSLGNRQYLVVAAYENKKFLLGICPDRIEMLAPLHNERPQS